MDVTFIEITPDHFKDVQTIFNHNLAYAQLENRQLPLTRQAFTEEFLNPETVSLLCRSDGGPFAIIDYLPEHPRDGSTWIGLFLIDGRYHHQGVGTILYHTFHERYLKNKDVIRLAVLPKNQIGQSFWRKLSYIFEQKSISNTNQEVEVFVKFQDTSRNYDKIK